MYWRVMCGIVFVVLELSGCAHPAAAPPAPVAPTLSVDANHPANAHGWVEVKLYFGLGSADHPEQGVSEVAWRMFLDEEVTPRFPSGLSVLDVYGQWQGKKEREPERLRSKMLLIYMLGDEQNRAKVDAIRAAWKAKTGDDSVLLVVEEADVSF